MVNRTAPDMNINIRALLALTGASLALIAGQACAQPPAKDKPATKKQAHAAQIKENAPQSVQEARGRARVLHETLHGALQVMHRDFFRDGERLKIPSRSLEDVFSELARSYGVKLHWIAVDLKAQNVDNEPKSDFEKQAARALKSGKAEFESVSASEFRFAGKIRLSATCLSCHASRRSNNDDRAAGLVIIMPMKITAEQK